MAAQVHGSNGDTVKQFYQFVEYFVTILLEFAGSGDDWIEIDDSLSEQLVSAQDKDADTDSTEGSLFASTSTTTSEISLQGGSKGSASR